ncbi:MAG: hypothetical protein IPM98_22050 [Lewinellaceae bacterium]|nr:hypothetical protein [Lewinellaceae bacterium]
MKHLFSFVLLLAAGVLPAQGPWEGLQRLPGTWKQFGKTVFEKWESAAPDVLLGEGYTLTADGEKRTGEYLRIVRQSDGGIVYQATVPGQNDGATIDFPLTFFTASSWTFENPAHDFPQTIEYWLQDNETLRATISGGTQSMVLWFNKVTGEQTKIPANLQGYDLFVSSRNTGTVERYDGFTGLHKGGFGNEQIGGETRDLALGPDGMLYVVSLPARHVLKFDPATGAFLGYFTSGFDLRNPAKLTFGPDGFLYVSQWGDGQGSVLRFDAATGRFDRDMTGPLAGPLGCTWDAAGNLYVACFYSKEVWMFRADGQFPAAVTPPGSLQGPSALWFAPDGDLLVADLDHVSIKRFRPEGAAFVYREPFADGFGRLEGVATGPDGFLYACDARMNLVKKLEADTGVGVGVYLEGGGMQAPNALVFWKR